MRSPWTPTILGELAILHLGGVGSTRATAKLPPSTLSKKLGKARGFVGCWRQEVGARRQMRFLALCGCCKAPVRGCFVLYSGGVSQPGRDPTRGWTLTSPRRFLSPFSLGRFAEGKRGGEHSHAPFWCPEKGASLTRGGLDDGTSGRLILWPTTALSER